MTDKDKVAELLKPRYKVVSDWPGRTDFIVGEIVILDKDFSPSYKKYEVSDCKGTRQYINSFFDMFPLQFKKLDWHENRNYSELPQYVKWSSPEKGVVSFFEVENWYTNPNTSQIAGVVTKEGRLFIADCQPATEADYLSYINKQSK
jgi:hypothetical protein